VTVEGDRAYALGANGDLSCRNVADGKAVWQINVLEKFGGKNPKWGISESPLIEKDLVICNAGGENASLVAINKRTGETVWTSKGLSDDPSYSSSMAITVGSVRQIIHLTHQNLVGVRADDGKLLWQYDKVNARTANIATPVLSGDHVLASTAYQMGGALLKLVPDGDGTRAQEVYFTKEMQNHHGGMVLVDGYLYGFSNAILTCLEFKTGNVMWSDRSVGKGCVVYADGCLYCLGEDGVMGLVEATPQAYRELSRFKIEKGKWPTWSHQVISHARLYIRNQDTISCYDIAAKDQARK
jgi:outer membrane protein assembly factor BamB